MKINDIVKLPDTDNLWIVLIIGFKDLSNSDEDRPDDVFCGLIEPDKEEWNNRMWFHKSKLTVIPETNLDVLEFRTKCLYDDLSDLQEEQSKINSEFDKVEHMIWEMNKIPYE